jgi:DNA-directed RNA polymerase subunit beta'
MKEKHSFLAPKPKFINKVIDKKELKKLMAWSFNNFGAGKASYMADRLKELGFHYATKAGISLSIEDLRVPPTKRNLLTQTTKEIKLAEQKYGRGEITAIERFQKIIDTWKNSSESLKNEVIRYFKETDPLNPVYIMAFSGARGNISQVRQLVGMRGLMSDPHGEIIALPIKSNFREGLTVTEYVISCYGARKGLVDTALRTADSGYLTRRLVDVAQDIIIREVDCGTTRGIMLSDTPNKDKTLLPLENRLTGRSLFETLYSPDNAEIIAHVDQDLNATLAKKIIALGIKSIYVRSPLTCESSKSVCQLCYGWSLAYGSLVDLGEAVGIIAAQSIGEPGTQLTMRTFHTGGVFTGEIAEQIQAPFNGVLRLPTNVRAKLTRTRHGNEAIILEEHTKVTLYNPQTIASKMELKQGTTLFLSDNEQFEKNQTIGEIYTKGNLITEKATKDLLSSVSGEVYFSNLSTETKTDRQGNSVTISQSGLLWILEGDVYAVPMNAKISVQEGSFIKKNETLATSETLSEYEGTIRLAPNRENEMQIITASTLITQAKIIREDIDQFKNQYCLEFENGKKFLLYISPLSKLTHLQPIGELIDKSQWTKTGGFIKYSSDENPNTSGNEYDLNFTQDSSFYWIPEETHEINKDISLLLIKNHEILDQNQEIIKGLLNTNSGFTSILEDNGIVREVIIKPGHIIRVDNLVTSNFNPKVFEPEDEICKRLNIKETCYIEQVKYRKENCLLVRPAIKYSMKQNESYLTQIIKKSNQTEIQLILQHKLLVKNGEKIKSPGPVNVLKTYLTVSISSNKPHLSADVEFIPKQLNDSWKLQLVILETPQIKRDIFGESNKTKVVTELVLKHGDYVTRGSKIADTKLLCKSEGTVKKIHSNNKTIRNILILTNTHKKLIPIDSKTVQISEGDLIRSGDQLAEGITSSNSGQIVKLEPNQITLRIGQPYLVSPDAILQVKNSDLIQSGDILAILVFERSKTGDIVQGLPKIEEILEARKPKEPCRLAQRPGKLRFLHNTDDSSTIKITESNGNLTEYTLQSSIKFTIGNGEYVSLADQLTEGAPNPHEILAILFNFYKYNINLYEAAKLSLQKVQIYLVNEVQSVYQSQNVDISDKHIEIIVRQMTSKVKVEDGGDTTLLPGELVELEQIENINKAMALTKGLQATYYPILLGITKSSLNTDSFISAASFQETIRVLTEAAIEGKTDWLRGLKENVIIGRLIPAGTGFNSYTENTKSIPLDIELNLESNNIINQESEKKNTELNT